MSLIDISKVEGALLSRLDYIRDNADKKVKWKAFLIKPSLLTLWQLWALLALVRQHKRQELVAEIVQRRLNVDLGIFASPDALHYLNVPQNGVVSEGSLQWHYTFHAKGCRITDLLSGETIDVDFHQASTSWVDEHHFIKRMKSLRSPPFVEARFIELHSSLDSVRLSIERLVNSGVLQRLGCQSVVQVDFDYLWLDDVLQEIEAHWHRKSIRRAVAAAMGDWFLLKELVSKESPQYARIRELARGCRA